MKETVTTVVDPFLSSRFLTIQSNSHYLVHSCRVPPQSIQRHFSRWVASKAGTSSEVRMVMSYARCSKMIRGRDATGIWLTSCHFDLFSFRDEWVKLAERRHDDLVMTYVLSSRDSEEMTERGVMRSWILTVGVGVVCRWMNGRKRPAYEEARVEWMKLSQVDGSEQS